MKELLHVREINKEINRHIQEAYRLKKESIEHSRIIKQQKAQLKPVTPVKPNSTTIQQPSPVTEPPRQPQPKPLTKEQQDFLIRKQNAINFMKNFRLRGWFYLGSGTTKDTAFKLRQNISDEMADANGYAVCRYHGFTKEQIKDRLNISEKVIIDGEKIYNAQVNKDAYFVPVIEKMELIYNKAMQEEEQQQRQQQLSLFHAPADNMGNGSSMSM